MTFKTMAWYTETGAESDVVVSTRIRLARNLIGFPFPQGLSVEQETEVCGLITAAFAGKPYETIDLNTVNSLDRRLLLEQNIVSQEFSVSPNKSIVLEKNGGAISAMINEEDHLRLAGFKSGLAIDELYQRMDRLDRSLEEHLHYAASLEFGFLTASMYNAGTGLRVSGMLHLPAVVVNGTIGWALKTISQLGLQIKGYWSEGENSLGDMYQVSNQICLGVPEEELLSNVAEGISHMMEYEREAREELLKTHKLEIEDKVHRALGILTHCRTITSKEAIERLAVVRFGACSGLLDVEIGLVTSLLIHSQKSHIQKMLESIDDETDNKLVDYTRAKLIRTALGKHEKSGKTLEDDHV